MGPYTNLGNSLEEVYAGGSLPPPVGLGGFGGQIPFSRYGPYFEQPRGGAGVAPANPSPSFGLGYTPGMTYGATNSQGARFLGFMNGRPVFAPQSVAGNYAGAGEAAGPGGGGPGAFGNGYFMGGLQSGGSGAMQRFIAAHRSY